jgi:hypothetical protein
MHWKFLRAGAVSPFTGFEWSVNAGSWISAEGVQACTAGIHACRPGDLPYWLTDELWGIELAEPVVEAERKVVAARARLLERVEAWTPDTARSLAEACVDRTAGHAADELREAGLDQEAGRLSGQPLAALAGIARDIMQSLPDQRAPQAATLCGYVVDAAEALPVYPVATVAYVAARAANRRSGPPNVNFYAAERAWQAEWLAGRLGL